MSLQPGVRLGSFEIVALVGAGGMGEVYRARDTKLNRDVAVKVLPDSFALDTDRLARFKREAQLLASLNHSNIAQIYGFEDSDGVHALVMELVEGPTLEEKLNNAQVSTFKSQVSTGAEPPTTSHQPQRALPLAEALAIVKQIAEALEAAHEQGIIHRDLKPANVKVREDGTVKVLDFGLAKAMDPTAASNVNASMSPTLSVHATMAGVILGTAAYMSPEQARGKPVDKRADIWAFGCVLYEMLTGRRCFDAGETVSDAIVAILKNEPDWAALPSNTPQVLRQLLLRCLRKDPKDRLHDIADARIELRDAMDSSLVGPTPPPRASFWRLALPWSVAATAVAILAVVGAGGELAGLGPARARSANAPVVTRFLLGVQPAEFLSGATVTNSQDRPTRTAIAWSPDGRTLVFGGTRAGRQQLYVRQLDRLDAQPLANTEGAVNPFFSPDGQSLGFWANGELKKVPIGGGPAVTICKAPLIYGATWAEGDIIFFDGAGTLGGGHILRVAASGGQPEDFALPDLSKGEASYRLPHALPGGKALLFTLLRDPTRLDDAQVVVRSLETGEQRTLVEGADARYVPTGHLLFVRLGTLLAAPFDLKQLKLTGAPVGLFGDVMQSANGRTVTVNAGAGQFSVSSTGSMAYATGGIFDEDLRSLVWVDRTGTVTPLALPPRVYWAPRLAPGGQRLAFYTRGVDHRVWIHDLQTGTTTALTEPGNPTFNVWTADGSRVTFADNGNLFWRLVDAGGPAEPLTPSQYPQAPGSWSPVGKLLAFVETNPATGPDIWLLSLDGGKPSSRPFINTRFTESQPDWSPDGRWLAYSSNESGRAEIYVQPYPGPGARYAVSRDGGQSPAWSHDGRELFYLTSLGDAAMMAVPVTTTPTFSVGTPRKLFEGRFQTTGSSRGYDVTADGHRFVMVQPRERPSLPVSEIVVVENWFDELKRLVPNK